MTRSSVAVLMLAVTALAACSGPAQSNSITVDGDEVVNAVEILQLAEQAAPQTEGIEDRCFFSRLGDEDGVTPLLRCGPKGNADKTRIGPWHTMTVEVTDTHEGVTLGLADDFGIGWELLPGETLARPDDLQPIPREGLNLPVATAFSRGINSLVGQLPLEYQRCMAEEGFIVFEMELVYDGMAQKLDSETIQSIGHQRHVIVAWGEVDFGANVAATEKCIEQIATSAGVGFERDDGIPVPASDS